MTARIMVLITISISVAGCRGDDVYTLYRSSPTEVGEHMRIHVASFDSVDGNDYNSENCEVARGLFQNQSGVTVKYWCEKGRFKP